MMRHTLRTLIVFTVAGAVLAAAAYAAVSSRRHAHRGAHAHAHHQRTRSQHKRAPIGPQLFGFNDNAVLFGESDPLTEVARNAAVGANVIRYTVNWDYVEPRRGQFNWHGYDPLYRAALAHHIRPVLIVGFAPQWARPLDLSCGAAAAHCHNPPDANHDADWSSFVSTLVKRYPKAAAVEIWNEPNLVSFWRSGPDPGRYAQLVDLAYSAVKAEEPSMPVLAGSLNNLQNSYDASIPYQQYLEAFLDQKPRFDGLSIHDYAIAGDSPDWFTETLDIARKELDAHVLDATPLWVTELGATTTGRYAVDPTTQATQIVGWLRTLAARPDVRAAIVHTVIPAPTGPTSDEYGYALMNSDGTPKPAYCALARGRLVAAPAGCAR